jgi:short-subunit dehydrogenase
VAIPGALLDTTAAQQDLQLEVNLHGVVRGLRLALPGMRARGGGHVVNIASAAGRIPSPNAAVYAATKHAVVGLTESVRSELIGTGVRVTAILPPVVRTEMSYGLRLHGLPTVGPDAVARAVVRVLTRRRPPTIVFVPRWVAGMAALDRLAPRWLGDLARKIALVAPPTDPSVRAAYDERISRQLRDLGPPDLSDR